MLNILHVGYYMKDKEYWRQKIILNLSPFRIMKKELQEFENWKHEMKTRKKKFVLLFSFDFRFPSLEVPDS